MGAFLRRNSNPNPTHYPLPITHYPLPITLTLTLTVTVTVTLTLTLILTVTATITLLKMHWFTFRSVHGEKSWRNPIQNALVYILFCVARKNSENRALGHGS